MKLPEIRIADEGDVIMPGNIACSTLTLAEIGAIFCVMALINGDLDEKHPRIMSSEMAEVMQGLIDRQIITVKQEDGKTKIGFNIQVEEDPPAADTDAGPQPRTGGILR